MFAIPLVRAVLSMMDRRDGYKERPRRLKLFLLVRIQKSVKIPPCPGFGTVRSYQPETADGLVTSYGRLVLSVRELVTIKLPIHDIGTPPIEGGLHGVGYRLLDLIE